MKASLIRIHSPDVFNLAEFIPKNSDNFGVLLQLIVGPLNDDGEESFDVMLCTPQWLIANHSPSDVIIGRHYLIVFEYNYQRIYNRLKRIVESVEAETWDDIAILIGRVGKWEFEDYNHNFNE